MNYLKQLARSAVEPHGKVRLLDDLSLLLWEGYAVAKAPRPRVASAARTAVPEVSAARAGQVTRERYLDPQFWRVHVLENLLPFWERHSPDREYGGFILHLDRQARVYDADADKSSGFQARMVYAFAAGYGLGGRESDLAIARRGVEFLIDRFWDPDHGGWYHSIRRDGTVRRAEKPLLYEGMVLLALLEYYRVSRDPGITRYLDDTRDLVERHGWDRRRLGYCLSCHRDWSVALPQKTLCAQLLFLAVELAAYRVSAEPTHLERLGVVADLVMTRMRDRKFGLLLENFDEDWRYHPLLTRDRILIGHQFKAARLLLEASRASSNEAFSAAARALVDRGLEVGWDHRHGGLFQNAFRNGLVSSGDKEWWAETEGLPALLLLHQVSGEARYLEYFTRLAEFCFTHFVDPTHGEWFTMCHADGSVKDANKGGHWKAAFHTVHAGVESCLALLQEAPATSPDVAQEPA